MKSFTKTKTTVYTPINILENFIVYDEQYISVRRNMENDENKCFKCDYCFKLGEVMSLASIKYVGNKVLCQKCASELKE